MDDPVDAYLYSVKVGDEVHTILEAPSKLKDDLSSHGTCSSISNIVMVDVSGSMCSCITPIRECWNSIIAPHLLGNTKMFTFSNDVKFRRYGPTIAEQDFDSEGTDLTGAIKQIRLEVEKSIDNFIRVFLVTDGQHCASTEVPDKEISKLYIPSGKVIEVYLLGIGYGFPVEYSINIRSALHNGNVNVPSIFWENEDDYKNQMYAIKDVLLKSFIELDISVSGYKCPGHILTDKIQLGEFMYYPKPPSELSNSITLSRIEDNDKKKILDVDYSNREGDLRFLLDKVFRQWNSILIQQHRNKKEIPLLAFDVMDKIYCNCKLGLEKSLEASGNHQSIQYRLAKKNVKCLEVEYSTLMNQSKTIIELDKKYEDEIELAKIILKTTVKSKYNTKTLKMRGHGNEEYELDMEKFKKIYEKCKEAILALPEPSTEECCNITFGSTVRDLQDPTFSQLLSEDKFTFMKTFCVTGIPVYAPVTDSSQINVWTMKIETILVTPYNLISQCTLELSAELGSGADDKDKAVYLQEGDDSSRFNAVIPVFTSEVGKVLKPLIRSNIFAMVATFSVLKNPHIIDMNTHMAALGCAFMKTIVDYPKRHRPEFAISRLSLIESTGLLYLDRKGYALYLGLLRDEPSEALMTESKKKFDELTIKCESLVKPAFFLYLSRQEMKDKSYLKATLKLMCLEFIGRCLSKYSGTTPYTDRFAPALSSNEKRMAWIDDKLKELVQSLLGKFMANHGDLLHAFFKLENMRKALKAFLVQEFKEISGSLIEISLNIEKLKNLKNISAAGDLNWNGLEVLASELDLNENETSEIFSEESAFSYVLHALQHKSSSDRLSSEVLPYNEAFKKVRREVESENCKSLKILASKRILEEAETKWRDQFMSAHTSFVRPLSKEELIQKALQKGIEVDSSSFSSIYKYNTKTWLVRNACMIESCPHYLKPDRTFNQHISIERQDGYPHGLHKISLDTAMKGGKADDVIQALLSGSKGDASGRKRKNTVIPSVGNLEAAKAEVEAVISHYNSLLGDRLCATYSN